MSACPRATENVRWQHLLQMSGRHAGKRGRYLCGMSKGTQPSRRVLSSRVRLGRPAMRSAALSGWQSSSEWPLLPSWVHLGRPAMRAAALSGWQSSSEWPVSAEILPGWQSFSEWPVSDAAVRSFRSHVVGAERRPMRMQGRLFQRAAWRFQLGGGVDRAKLLPNRPAFESDQE